MVMSGGGQGDPRDDESTAEQAVVSTTLPKPAEALCAKDGMQGPTSVAPFLTGLT